MDNKISNKAQNVSHNRQSTIQEVETNVYILPFKFKHIEALQEMHMLQGKPNEEGLTMRDLPKIGFIAFLGKSAVAAGFLRRVEPHYAQMDTFVSNPHFGSLIRHDGMNKVVDALLIEAKDLNLKGIIAFTKDISIVNRAKEQGFYIVEQTMLALRL